VPILVPLLIAYFTHRFILLRLLFGLNIGLPILIIILAIPIQEFVFPCPQPSPDRIIQPCPSIGLYVSLGYAILLTAEFIASIAFIIFGSFQWFIYRADQVSKTRAKARVITGIIILLMMVCSFIGINIVEEISGLGNLDARFIRALN
jgi:hypothetical protein